MPEGYGDADMVEGMDEEWLDDAASCLRLPSATEPSRNDDSCGGTGKRSTWQIKPMLLMSLRRTKNRDDRRRGEGR